MNATFIALLILTAGGAGTILLKQRTDLLPAAGTLLTLAACLIGLLGAAGAFIGGFPISFPADRLSALFQLPILIVGAVAAFHARGYLAGHDTDRHWIFWMFFQWTLAAMLAVTLARMPVEFLIAWEIMGITSFVLVAFEYHDQEVRQAAWIYLLACHAGAAFLIPAIIYGVNSGWTAGVLLLGLAGFGLKAGFPLLHVWLPVAHPAAPAPVSAVMSGAMINLGFYGILRMPHAMDAESFRLLGWCLLAMGLAGALGGVLFAMIQKNLKRLLAYSSVENMGIIGIGLGLGFLGASEGAYLISAAGFTGAFLHILNHAVLKGALFLAAGSVLRATGSLNMDKAGGLLKRMPVTGGTFLYSSISLSGLPPFNGFTGELMIYFAAFSAILSNSQMLFYAGLPVLPLLALTGGLAAAAFAKASGAVFLGEPRSEDAASAVERPRSMTLPLLILTGLSLVLLFLSPLIADLFLPAVSSLTNTECDTVISAAATLRQPLLCTAGISLLTILLMVILLLLRRTLPRGKQERIAPTWDCGFAEPTARMEYTGSAFSQPLTDYFSLFLRPVKKLKKPEGLFPTESSLDVTAEDAADRTVWHPLFRFCIKVADRIHHLQSGYLHLYILIMVIALLAMLVWGFLFDGGVSK